MSLGIDKSSWRRVTFGDVVRNVNETVKDAAASAIDRVIAMEHMDPGELKVNRWGDAADGTTFTRRVRPGQTLFGKRRAYQRKVAYAEFEAICSGDIYTFEADGTRMLGEFLPFLVQSDRFFDHALDTSAGSLSPRTNWRELADFEFELPPLDEQKRIAELLWGIEHHGDSLAILPGAIEAAYDSWLEDRLAHAPRHPLAEAIELLHGRPVPSSLYGKGEFALLRPGDMKPDGSVAWTGSSVGIPREFAEQYSGWILEPGNVVINMTAQSLEDRFLGRVCKLHDRALLNQRIGRLTSKGPISMEFAYVALRSESFSRWVAQRSEGSKVKHMHWRHIADYPLPVPVEAEQMAVVDEARTWSDAIERSRDESRGLRSLSKSITVEIFGGN